MVRRDPTQNLRAWMFTVIVMLLASVTTLHAQDSKDSDEEFDTYKLRVSAFLFYSNPSGDIQGSHDADMVDLQKDFAFNSYSTFTGKLDWKFTHKNHIYLVGSDFSQTKQVVLRRTITYQGQTFEVGASVRANLDAPEIAPGYEYDFIRRKRGHLHALSQPL